jgi:hypothetical protein
MTKRFAAFLLIFAPNYFPNPQARRLLLIVSSLTVEPVRSWHAQPTLLVPNAPKQLSLIYAFRTSVNPPFYTPSRNRHM